MKTVIIKNVEVSAEEIQKLVRDNPDLLKPEVKGRYFFPKTGQKFWFIDTWGDVSYGVYTVNPEFNKYSSWYLAGIYETETQATLARDKQKAIVACWKWAQENAPFEPDWGECEQKKYCSYYHTGNKELLVDYSPLGHYQFTLPYFKSREDCQAFIKANKENLELLFTK